MLALPALMEKIFLHLNYRRVSSLKIGCSKRQLFVPKMGQHRSAQLLNHYLTLSFGLDKVVEVVGNVEAIEEEVELSECLA